MSSSATTPADTTASAASTTKKSTSKSAKSKPSNIVVLRLPPALLHKFPSDTRDPKPPTATSNSPPEDTKVVNLPITKGKQEPVDDTKDSNGTTAAAAADAEGSTSNPPGNPDDGTQGSIDATAVTNGLKRKTSTEDQGGSSGKATNGVDSEGKPKPKAAPKRRKLDGEGKGMWTAPPHLNHRLGPKANQGDINARLRALDRSGNPCRRWQRKGLQFASFTRVKWGMGGWKTTKMPEPVAEDVQSETTGSSEPKQEPPSSNVASEKSNAGGQAEGGAASAVKGTATPLPSSPAPEASVTA